jgi:anti-sigma factor RsiW
VNADCRTWRGDLAARALGHRDPARDPGLDAHLDGCPECRAELLDLRMLADTLAEADPTYLAAPEPDPGLGDRVLHRIAFAASAQRARRRRAGAAIVAVAAAILVVVAGVAVAGRGSTTSATEVALAGPGDLAGEAELVDRPWGTEVHLDVSGLDEGEVYWLWLSSAEGDRVVAGTLTGTGGEASAVLAAALPFDDAARVWMTDERDDVVLDATVPAD